MKPVKPVKNLFGDHCEACTINLLKTCLQITVKLVKPVKNLLADHCKMDQFI